MLWEAQLLHACNPSPPGSLYRLTFVYICKSCGQQSQLVTPSSCGTEHEAPGIALRAAWGTDPQQLPLVQESHPRLRASQPQAGPKLWPASVRKINYLAPFCNMAKDCFPGIVACADVRSGHATVVLQKGMEGAADGATQQPRAWTGGAQPCQQEHGDKAGLGSREGRLRSCSLDHTGCAM